MFSLSIDKDFNDKLSFVCAMLRTKKCSYIVNAVEEKMERDGILKSKYVRDFLDKISENI
jgi:hypothetical protein